MALFLATTDSVCDMFWTRVLPLTSVQTIVSTSLPTIATDLSASQTQYIWVGVAYMLTQTACQPLYGKLSDLVGRKVCISLPKRTTYVNNLSECLVHGHDDICPRLVA